MSCHCAPEISNSYFVVMIDYQSGRGREAIVDPEVTKREVLSRIRSKEYDPARISFIHFCDDGVVSDVTRVMLAEASERVAA